MLRSKIWILGLLIASVAACASDDPSDDTKVLVIKPDVQDVSPPLSQLANVAAPDAASIRAHEAEPVRPVPHMRLQSAAQQQDPVVQNAIGGADIPSPIVSFEGMGAGLPGFTVQAAPPDTDGDIGPNHYVQIVNIGVTIFNRAGARLLGPINTNALWSGFAGACATTNDGDGVVRYDRLADRWVISQFSVNGGNGPFFQCVAVSTTPDPTGSYNRYQFTFNAFNDYPKMGLWPDGYYFTFNMFPNNQFGGARVCAFDRLKMLAGQPATEQCFDTGPNFGGLLPSDLDGPTLPPAGSPNFSLALDTTSTLALFKMHVDFATPANSTFSAPTTITVASFNPLCNAGTCVRQPGTTTRLDSLADRLMNRLVYRRFSDHEALLASHAVDAGTGGGVRFYELRNPAAPTVFQQGTYAPDAAFRWMSSAAFDTSGNIGLGFAISSTAISPSVRYTGRLATDPLGTMGQGEATLIAGAGAQTGGLTRYGDYSSLNIDPTDDCTFWYTQEYIAANGAFNWHTRIGSFKFATCGMVVNDFSITPNPTSRTVAAGASTTYAINTAVVSGAAQTVALSVSGLPAGVTGSFSPTSVTAGGSSTLTLTVAAGTGAGTTSFTITGTGTSVTHTASASITVTAANQAPVVTITAPANGSTVSGTAVPVAATATDPDGTVASVKFDLPDGTSVTDTTAPFATTFDSTKVVNASGYVIRATATDNQGATGVATVTITVANNARPTVTITAPANGSTVSGTIPVTATATDPDGTVASVKFDLPDGTSVTDTTAPFATTFDSTKVVNASGYVIRATATDNQGATGAATVTITVANNAPPSVTITAPANGSTVSTAVPVTATATDPDGTVASVKFDLPDGTSVTDTTAPFATTFDSTNVVNASGYVIRATATDNQGATAVATVTITVANCLDNTFSATNLPIAIPDADPIGITSSIPVTGNGTVTSLSLSLSITHPFRGDLAVTLISPAGTQFSVTSRVGGSADDLLFANLAIPTFSGQTAAGTWKLKVQDLAPGDAGTLVSWSLAIVGRCTQAAQWSGSATPNLPTVDNGMMCTSLTVATTGGDASLAKLDLSGRHDFRSILRGTLAHNGVTVEAFPTGTFPTGSGTFSFTSRAVPGFSGDASGTWTFCIIDTDAFGDTGVLNTWSVHN